MKSSPMNHRVSWTTMVAAPMIARVPTTDAPTHCFSVNRPYRFGPVAAGVLARVAATVVCGEAAFGGSVAAAAAAGAGAAATGAGVAAGAGAAAAAGAAGAEAAAGAGGAAEGGAVVVGASAAVGRGAIGREATTGREAAADGAAGATVDDDGHGSPP